LTSLPSEIGRLRKLAMLDVRNNRLTYIPLTIIMSHPEIYINVDDNPLEGVPISVIAQRSYAILFFLQEQYDPHVVTRTFWMAMIMFPVTLVAGAWVLIQVWACM
jgi:hypothetical protein